MGRAGVDDLTPTHLQLLLELFAQFCAYIVDAIGTKGNADCVSSVVGSTVDSVIVYTALG